MMASHSGTCVVMPGWNGPKLPCVSAPRECSSEVPLFQRLELIPYANQIEHGAVVAQVEVRHDGDELLLGLATRHTQSDT
jgi:hypothetical protein